MFGPVLHVLRFKREALPALIDALNATGYALTGGVHSRIDATIALVASRIAAGNVYVNRNIIGAVVGVQPFGGHGLSGTGPKAGGPLYLKRLLAAAPAAWPALPAGTADAAATAFAAFVAKRGDRRWRAFAQRSSAASRLGAASSCPVPSARRTSIRSSRAAPCCATPPTKPTLIVADRLRAGDRQPRAARRRVRRSARRRRRPSRCATASHLHAASDRVDAALTDREGAALIAFAGEIARRDGPIASVFRVTGAAIQRGEPAPLDFLLNERSVCINTTAAGGNASLMTIG